MLLALLLVLLPASAWAQAPRMPEPEQSRPWAVYFEPDAGARAVVEAIGTCVADSLAYERSRDDMSRSKDRPGAVHGRAGEACPRCGDTVRSVTYASYRVDYCATCQTGGKVLADNTTSKFLK